MAWGTESIINNQMTSDLVKRYYAMKNLSARAGKRSGTNRNEWKICASRLCKTNYQTRHLTQNCSKSITNREQSQQSIITGDDSPNTTTYMQFRCSTTPKEKPNPTSEYLHGHARLVLKICFRIISDKRRSHRITYPTPVLERWASGRLWNCLGTVTKTWKTWRAHCF